MNFKSLSKRGYLPGLLHIFFPQLCEGCRQPLLQSEEIICLSCESFLTNTNYHHLEGNETALRLTGRIPFIRASSLCYFSNDSLVKFLIHKLKYHDKQSIGIYLGKRIGQSLQVAGWDFDIVIPVPLHKKKNNKRGFNQSELSAEGISLISKKPVVADAVVRIRDTETQTDKTREERISNVANAFKVKNAASLTGKHILLVDDVLTTGATIEACSHSLAEIDGLKISIATSGIAVD
jgi:ComF family protein